MAPLQKITFHRIIAFLCCGVFAIVGSFMFFLHLFYGVGGTPAPQPSLMRHDLANAGMTTKAAPLFQIDRQGNERVAIEGRTSHSQVARGERVPLAASIGVQTWGSENPDRRPVDVALVFDVSGSMRGAPLRNVQIAAESLVTQLEPGDRVSLVAYSSSAWVVAPATPVTNATRPELLQAIRELHADGGTNISAGWEAGHGQLVDGTRDRTRRIVMLSDGQANEGIMSTDVLARMTSSAMESGITTTSMGVGLDYNEDLLQSMARSGGGNYYFVHDSSPSTAFDTELKNLTESVTSRAVMTIRTDPNFSVARIDGYDWRTMPDGSIEVELGSLAANMRRDVLIEFAVAEFGRAATIVAEVSWHDEQGLAQKTGWSQMIAPGETAFDSVVMSRVQKVKTARALDDATRMYETGARHEAANRLDAMVADNEVFIDEYEVDEDTFDRANDKLGTLAEQMREYDPNSRRGLYMIKGSKFQSANVAVDSSVTF